MTPLAKRLPRELRHNIGKYLGIFLLMCGSIALTSGFLLAAHSIGCLIDDMRDGRLVELVLDDASVAQAQHAVGHVGDGGVMGDDDDGAAVGAVDVLHELQDFLGCLVVERARGFVTQQQARVFDERAADGAALLLAAGDLAWELVAVLPKAE